MVKNKFIQIFKKCIKLLLINSFDFLNNRDFLWKLEFFDISLLVVYGIFVSNVLSIKRQKKRNQNYILVFMNLVIRRTQCRQIIARTCRKLNKPYHDLQGMYKRKFRKFLKARKKIKQNIIWNNYSQKQNISLNKMYTSKNKNKFYNRCSKCWPLHNKH